MVFLARGRYVCYKHYLKSIIDARCGGVKDFFDTKYGVFHILVDMKKCVIIIEKCQVGIYT